MAYLMHYINLSHVVIDIQLSNDLDLFSFTKNLLVSSINIAPTQLYLNSEMMSNLGNLINSPFIITIMELISNL